MWNKRNPHLAVSADDPQKPHLTLTLRTTPRYVYDRARINIAGRRQTPGEFPWITRDAIDALTTLLRPTDVGLEFGSGGSTVWLARRTASVSSVEAFDSWHGPLAERIAAAGLRNVNLQLVSADTMGHNTEAHRQAYVNAFPDLAEDSLDFVFVDAEYRDESALRGITLLKPGGLMIVDNVSTFLPHPGRSPWTITEPASEKWATFAELVAGWRYIWTTNGVWDTAIWIKS
jgi:predicted O-methyltransferase YrrM